MTFVAFGALTVAAALPANADTVLHGSATAVVAGHELYLNGTPQGETNSNSQSFDEQVASYLTVNAEASNWVDADGTHSAVTVNNAHAQLTMDDIIDIIESTDTEELSSEGGVEDLLAEEGVGTLDETEDDEIVLDVEFRDASISVSKAWDGTYSTTFDPAEVVINDSAFDVEIDTETVEGEGESQDRYDEDITWDVAYNALFGTFLSGGFVLEFKLAEVNAGTSDLVVDDGDGGGDDQNPPPGGGDDDGDKPGDGDEGGKGGKGGKGGNDGDKDGKDAKGDDKKAKDDDLARTGSPIAALIAAGAAITAGGGAAAYLARRKKKNNEEFNETDEG